MNKTEELFREDSYAKVCEAEVLAVNDLGGIILDIDRQHFRAVRRQPVRNRATDPVRRARHNGNLAAQSLHSSALSLFPRRCPRPAPSNVAHAIPIPFAGLRVCARPSIR